MKRLFNNRWFVITLAAGAFILMVRSVVAPLLERPDFSDVPPPEDYVDKVVEGQMLEGFETTPPGPQYPTKPRSAVLNASLSWNGSPTRDPFESRADTSAVATSQHPVEPVTDGQPRLDALVSGPVSLFAVIDGRIVREGDRFAGYRIERIGRDGVLVSGARGRVWLTIPGPDMPSVVTTKTDS